MPFITFTNVDFKGINPMQDDSGDHSGDRKLRSHEDVDKLGKFGGHTLLEHFQKAPDT